MSDVCPYCQRDGHGCRSTRDMEESAGCSGRPVPVGDPICFAALMMLGGGERSVNQAWSVRLRRLIR